MKTAPNISAAILSYNRGAYLEEALQSLLSQTLPPSRITIFDNGSDPSVREHVERFIQSEAVCWRGAERNMGVHWNLARAFAEGSKDSEFLYVMHDDDRLCPEFLAEQSAFLSERSDCVAAGCNAFEIDGDGRRTGRLLHKPERRRDVEIYDDLPAMVRLYMRTYLAFPSVLYRSAAAAGVVVRQEFGPMVDVVLLTELARAGSLAYVNKPLLEYRVHASQDSRVLKKEEDCRRMDEYYRSVVAEFPSLGGLSVEFYLARRRLSHAWKRFKRSFAGGKNR